VTAAARASTGRRASGGRSGWVEGPFSPAATAAGEVESMTREMGPGSFGRIAIFRQWGAENRKPQVSRGECLDADALSPFPKPDKCVIGAIPMPTPDPDPGLISALICEMTPDLRNYALANYSAADCLPG
jgi:hypothetical protein